MFDLLRSPARPIVKFARQPAFAVAVGALVLAAACSDEVAPDKDKKDSGAATDAADGGAEDTTTVQDTGVVDAGPTDTGAPKDTGSKVEDVGVDSGPEDSKKAEDTGLDTGSIDPVDAGPECKTAADCTGKVSPQVCEQPACKEGKCTLELKPASCCEDSHCNDAKECTADKCVQATNTCEHKKIPNCCSGKLNFLKVDFESDLGGLATKDGATNGNVAWQLTNKRAHKGQQSLYFGNDCGTYDNAMTQANGCTEVGKGSAVSGSVSTKSFALPGDKQSQLHFWLFMATEPMYADTLPKGTCAQSCKTGSSCVNINGSSTCLPEKDNLVVQVVADKAGTVTVFDSTAIKKSTGGKWQRVVVYLEAYKGQNIQLRWSFSTGTGHKNNFEGLYLDTIVLETVCAVEGTLCGTSQACLDDGNPCSADVCSYYANKEGAGVCFHDTAPGCCTNADQCDDGQPCTADTCNNGSCENKPDSTKASCCKPKVLHNDDFESGVLTDWQLSSNSQTIKWRINPSGGQKKSQALYFGNSAFDGYDDPTLGKGKGVKGSACTKEVTFSSGTVFNMVTFALKLETEFSYLPAAKYKNPPLLGKPKYDFLWVTADVAGKQHELWTSDMIYGTTDGEWQDITAIVPSKLHGQSGQVCLHFQTGDDQVNDKEGVTIDQLLVRVTCEKKPCYYDAECSAQCGGCMTAGCTEKGCGCKKIPGCCSLDKDCEDGDPCTANTCVNKKCQSKPIEKCCKADSECTAADKCKNASCDPGTHQCKQEQKKGCCLKSADCEDFDPCTIPSCDEATSTCKFKPVAGCCNQDSECDDKDKCTAENCIDGKCYYKKSGEPGCPK